MEHLTIKILFTFFLCTLFLCSNGQIIQLPIAGHFEQNKLTQHKYFKSKKNISAKVAKIITLPFFDDFSLSFGQPDTNLWINGGTQVSNHTAVRPPSKGTVQFDGSNFYGVPYVYTNQLSKGPTDSLTSQIIDLSYFLPQDSLAITFFFQPQGLGEQPDGAEGDSLWLEFKISSGAWAKVWAQGGTALTEFKKVKVSLKDPLYFNSQFQFRFRSFGRQSGAYDSWQLDYVYFDTNSNKHKYFRDVAATSRPTSFLKRYSAMPINQFLANKTAEVADTLVTYIYNVNDSLNNYSFPSFKYSLSDFNSGTVYDIHSSSPDSIGKLELKRIVISPIASAVPNINKPIILKSSFNFITGDTNTYIPGVNFKVNDTITNLTVLNNYYAYDDGSAEYAGGINEKLGRVAIQFHANEPDTLTALQFYLPQIGRSLAGQSFIMLVLKKLDNNPSSIIYQSSVNIDSLNFNKLVTYPFDSSQTIIVSDTFYVGWQQIATTDLLNVGIDKNNPNASKYIYYNLGGNNYPWQPSADIQGAFIVRPVFGQKNNVVQGIEDDFNTDFKVYPNPSDGKFYWEGLNVNEVSIYDIFGNNIYNNNKINLSNNLIDLSDKAPGIYLIHFYSGKKKIIKKIVLVK